MSALYGIGDPNGGDIPPSTGTPEVMGKPAALQPMVTFEPGPSPTAAPAVEVAPSPPPAVEAGQSGMIAPQRTSMAAPEDPPAPKEAGGNKTLTVIIGLLGLIALSYYFERATKR